MCIYICLCFSSVRTSASVSDLLRYFCFLAYFVFYFAYSVDFLWSGKSGLFLINYISSGGILCRQFNISIHVGHVERKTFTTVYPSRSRFLVAVLTSTTYRVLFLQHFFQFNILILQNLIGCGHFLGTVYCLNKKHIR
jgi:hypothetical protein